MNILGENKTKKKVPGVEGPKNDHFGQKKKKKNGRLRDFHESEKVTILGKKKKKKIPGVEGPKNDHFGPKKKKKKNGRLRDCHKSEKVTILGGKKIITWSGRYHTIGRDYEKSHETKCGTFEMSKGVLYH